MPNISIVHWVQLFWIVRYRRQGRAVFQQWKEMYHYVFMKSVNVGLILEHKKIALKWKFSWPVVRVFPVKWFQVCIYVFLYKKSPYVLSVILCNTSSCLCVSRCLWVSTLLWQWALVSLSTNTINLEGLRVWFASQ